MHYLTKLQHLEFAQRLLTAVLNQAEQLSYRLGRRLVVMEVCGTHTTAISSSGLRSLLKEAIELRSGPGCPVCVTDILQMDQAISLAQEPGVIIATFGDMLRVPGNKSSLEREKARGAKVQVIYSPLEAVELAATNPNENVVLLGIGFETTAPLVALSLLEAKKRGVKNYSVLSLHKVMPPALMALLDSKLRPNLDGLLLPGHVCAITGYEVFNFITTNYQLPAVVTGFDAAEILGALYTLLVMLKQNNPRVFNGYPSVVKTQGNQRALEVLRQCFELSPTVWRGLGKIAVSGLKLRDDWQQYDATKKYQLTTTGTKVHLNCRCGQLLQGFIVPPECPQFNKGCTPSHPLGPCMVSAEGACATYYQYERG